MIYIKAVVASIIFLILLLLIYYLHINFFLVDVVFYSAIFDGILATIITGFVLVFHRGFVIFQIFDKIQMIIIWILFSYIFAISIPTVLDRSLSFYLLEKINQRGGGISLDSFEDVIVNEYISEHRLVDIRITEQINSGTIVVNNNCVLLTNRGKNIARFSLYFRKNFLPKKRLIMGEYTNDLTNPFRDSLTEFNYGCE